jgi:hypothetical protein
MPNSLTFPLIYYVTYCMLEKMLKMTFTSRTSLTRAKKITACCLNLLSRNYQYCTPDEMAGA